MSQDQIHEVKNIFLTIVGSVTGAAGFTLAGADLAAGLFLKLVSIVSVSMLVVINRKKFVNEIKSWFKWKK